MKQCYSFMVVCVARTNSGVTAVRYHNPTNHFGGTVEFDIDSLKAEVADQAPFLESADLVSVLEDLICADIREHLSEHFDVASLFFTEPAVSQLSALVATPEGVCA